MFLARGNAAMPRPRRFHVSGGIYHVTLRGNHRQKIFHCPDDYQLIDKLVDEITIDHGLSVHAFCWMPNHIHLAVEVADQPLAKPMQKLASVYARRVQARQPTTGHFFERRYHAVLVDSERYLFALIRYIHLNPVRAALVATPRDYRWSSHRAYLGGPSPRWLCFSRALGRLGRNHRAARAAYCQLMQQQSTAEELDYLRGSGARNDELESGAIKEVQAPRMAPSPGTLDDVIRGECARLGVDPRALLGPDKHRQHVMARARITWRARSLGLGTLGDLAAKLGRSPASLSEGLRRARQQHPNEFAAEPVVADGVIE
jgi:REP element-mobilizing transposase RayT